MNAAYSGPIYEAASDDSSSLKHKSMSLNAQSWKEKWRPQQGHRQGSLSNKSAMTIPASEMRKESRREIRKRLREELSLVQGLYSRLEARESQLRRHSESTGVYPTLSDAQFSGNDARSTAGKEVTSSSPTFAANYKVKHARANGTERKGKSGKKKPDYFSQCKVILKKLMGHKDGWVFNEPVDAAKLGLSDYHYFIKKPMDLGTIKAKLDKKAYTSPEKFASDVQLTFDNAMTYNPPGNDVHEMAKGLLRNFEKAWAVINGRMEKQGGHNEYSDSRECMGELSENPLVESVMQSYQKVDSTGLTVAAKNKKPKPSFKPKSSVQLKAPPKPQVVTEKKVDTVPKREMTYEEKASLVANLQLLPAHMQDELIRLMKERNPNLSQKDDEIEVDIDTFDNDTLWELDACVKNGLKAAEASKNAGGEKDQPIESTMESGEAENFSKQTGYTDEPLQDEDTDIVGVAPKATSPTGGTIQNDVASGGNRPSGYGSSSSAETGSSSDSDSESSSSGSDVDGS